MSVDRKIPAPSTGSSTVSDAASWADSVQEEVGGLWDRSHCQLSNVAGTNVLTATCTPTVTALVAGMRFSIVPANDNTGAATLAIDGLAAVDILSRTGSALVGGELNASERHWLEYNGSALILMTPSSVVTSNSPVPGAIFEDQKAANTAGGTFTSGADQTRTLNTTVRNVIGASLSSDQITLLAGTYYVRFWATAYRVKAHKAWIYNVTDASVAIVGSSAYSHDGEEQQGMSIGSGVITITSTKVFTLRHRCTSTLATNGYGLPANVGQLEKYAQVEIWRVIS